MQAVRMTAGDMLRFKLPDGGIAPDPRRAGVWLVRPPLSGTHDIDSRWTVTEHEDGTITITPLIDTGAWHGTLLRGVWTELPRPFIDKNMVVGGADETKFTTPAPAPTIIESVTFTEEMLDQGAAVLAESGYIAARVDKSDLRSLVLDMLRTMIKVKP